MYQSPISHLSQTIKDKQSGKISSTSQIIEQLHVIYSYPAHKKMDTWVKETDQQRLTPNYMPTEYNQTTLRKLSKHRYLCICTSVLCVYSSPSMDKEKLIFVVSPLEYRQ